MSEFFLKVATPDFQLPQVVLDNFEFPPLDQGAVQVAVDEVLSGIDLATPEAITDAVASAALSASAAADAVASVPALVESELADPNSAAGMQLSATFASVRTMRPNSGYSVALGDSITAYYGDGTQLRVVDTWFPQLCVRSGQRIRFGGTFGTGGFTVEQVRDTHLPQVLALNPRPAAAFIFAGTNNTDQNSSASGFVALEDMCAQLIKVGIIPILVSLLPRSAPANNANHKRWNVALRQFATARGLILWEPGSALLTAGVFATALYADTVHPNHLGHKALGIKGVADSLPTAFPPAASITAKEVDDASNLIAGANALFTTQGGSKPGAAGTWGVSGNTGVTYAMVEGAVDGLSGNWQRFTREVGGTGTTMAALAGITGFAAGDRLALSGRFRATVEGTGSKYSIQAQQVGATGGPHNPEALYLWECNVADGTFYVEFVVPAGTTSLTPQIQMTVPTSGTSVLDVGEFTIRNLTTGADLLP